MLSQEKERRVIESINETNILIEKEEKYSDKFQKKDYLESLYNHLEKLNSMLKGV